MNTPTVKLMLHDSSEFGSRQNTGLKQDENGVMYRLVRMPHSSTLMRVEAPQPARNYRFKLEHWWNGATNLHHDTAEQCPNIDCTVCRTFSEREQLKEQRAMERSEAM